MCVLPSDADERPTLPMLQDVMRIKDIGITTRWRDLGLRLLDSNSVLDEIEANHHNDVNTCFRVMFNKWLERVADASWTQLVTALKSIEMNTAASAISELFKSGNFFL